MKTFQDLDAWKESHKLVLMIYKATKKFPKEEMYRLTSQICRSSASVAANLVEGNSRLSRKEHIQFVNLAKGSLEETKYHLLLSKDLKYLSESDYNSLLEQANLAGRLVSGLLRYLRTNI